MNKFIKCLLIFLIAFTVVGCGSNKVYDKEHEINEVINNLEFNDYIILFSTNTVLDQTFDRKGNRYWMDTTLSYDNKLFNYIDYPFFIDDNVDNLTIIITNQINNYSFTLVSNVGMSLYANDYFVRIEKGGEDDLRYIYSTNFEGVYYTNNNTTYRYTIKDEFDESSSYESLTKSGEEKCKEFVDGINKELKNINVSIKDLVNLKSYLIDNYYKDLTKRVNNNYLTHSSYNLNIDDVINTLNNKGCSTSLVQDGNSVAFVYSDSPNKYMFSIYRNDDNVKVMFDPLDTEMYDNIYCISKDDGENWKFIQRSDEGETELIELPFYKSPWLNCLEDGNLTLDIMLIDGYKNTLLNYLGEYSLFEVVDLIKNY